MPNVTITNTATGLTQVQHTYGRELHQKLRIGLEWENMVPFRMTDKTHTEPNASVTEILQPYQWQYTPKGSATLDAVSNTLQIIKADVKMTDEDLAVFYDSWQLEWFEAGKDPKMYSFPRYLYEVVYLPKVMEELNQMEWNGVYAAPTPGTAGAYLTSMDGFKTKIAAAVAAGKLSEIPTGAISSGSIVDQVESFCDTIPQPYKDLPGKILMSSTNSRAYWRNYRALFGTGNGVSGNNNDQLRVDATKKMIAPMSCMDVTSSDRFIFVPDGVPGMILGTRRGFPQMLNLRWEAQERIVKGLGEFYRFAGFTFWQHVFVNDQQ